MGSGFRTFQSGEVLTAANVQDYLMDQSVQVFAGTAALGSAIGTAVEQGMVAYLTDSDQLVHYAANTAEGTAWQTIPMRGGPVNRIINGGMDVWQRGTSLNHAASAYTADRFSQAVAAAVPTGTVSRQSFTAGSAPAAPYEAPFFMRINITANNGCTAYEMDQKIEDVRTFAGQTVTFSFWAKADAACTITALLSQDFGSGGSSTVTPSGINCSLTTSWQRFSCTYTLGSMSGKTIGTSSYLRAFWQMPVTSGTVRVGTYDFWGVQVEAGSYASPFELEDYGTTLAKCQRYFLRLGGVDAPCQLGHGTGDGSTNGRLFQVPTPVTLRALPTLTEGGALKTFNSAITDRGFGATNNIQKTAHMVNFGVALTGSTAGEFLAISADTTSDYLDVSAEL